MGYQTCSTHGIRYEDYGECPQCATERRIEDSIQRQEELTAESVRLQRAAGQQNWEHRSVVISKDSTTGKWGCDRKDGTRIEGMINSLDRLGSTGWELVAFVPESWDGSRVMSYRAVFKRIAQ